MTLRTSIPLGLTAVAAAAVLTGCGGPSSPGRTATADRPPSPTPSAAASTKGRAC
ncbi:MAG TPA: hypothetical protein VGJ19_00625 [Streptosporangiaceae bacterium]